MKKFIERNMAISILFFSLLGLVVPYVDKLPAFSVDVIIALVIFIACFRINFKEIFYINYFSLASFYILRFIILPLLIYFLVRAFSPNLALGLLLLTLLPPATATPALTQIFKGDVSLSFAFVIGVSLLTPLVLPMIFLFVVGKSVKLNILAMWFTLVLTLFLPVVLFYGVRNQKKLIHYVHENGSFFAIILIGLAFAIAIAKQKALIFQNPLYLLKLFLIATGMFFLFYLVGWMLAYKKSKTEKIAYMLSAGAINISLGVSLALLYFSSDIILLLILGQFSWILAMSPFRLYANRSND